MKFVKGLFATAAAAALLTGSAASAAANPAASLSIAGSSRGATTTAHDSGIGAEISTGTLISIGILAALVVIVLVATGDDSPDSP